MDNSGGLAIFANPLSRGASDAKFALNFGEIAKSELFHRKFVESVYRNRYLFVILGGITAE